MPRYIEESCVLERLKPYIADLGYEERANLKASYISVADAMSIIEDAPTADVAPVVHGHWIFGEFDGIGRPVWCSECGNRTKNVADPVAWLNYPEHKYCGRCGAKMDKNTEVK